MRGREDCDRPEALRPGLTLAQLIECTGCDPAVGEAHLPFIVAAMDEFQINTPFRRAAFLAQMGHESDSLKAFTEYASGAAYDTGRLAARLGNTPEADGDGQKYKGRSPTMLTGHDNYKKYGEALGVDLLNHPELAATPEVGWRIAGKFWVDRRLNEIADLGKQGFHTISVRINGGENGRADRERRFDKCCEVFGC